MIAFKPRYFCLALILFVIEVLIALYVHDRIIRPYIGDYLVVIFIYCAVRTIVDASVVKTAVGVLLFSYLVEVLQYFHFVKFLGLQNSRLAQIVMGSSFEWVDLLAYTFGIITVMIIEKMVRQVQLVDSTMP